MKQFKKFSTLLLLLAAVAMTFTSCKKDDEDGKHDSRLIGTWVYEKFVSYGGGSSNGYTWFESYEFKSNGKCNYAKGSDRYGVEDEEDIKWTSTKNTITFYWEDDDPGTVRYSISDDEKTLTIYWSDNDEGRVYYKK